MQTGTVRAQTKVLGEASEGDLYMLINQGETNEFMQ